MILEPSEELQQIYDKAVQFAVEHQHEYLTLEHLVLAIITDEKFNEFLKDYPGDLNYAKINLEHFIKNNKRDEKEKKNHTNKLYIRKMRVLIDIKKFKKNYIISSIFKYSV